MAEYEIGNEVTLPLDEKYGIHGGRTMTIVAHGIGAEEGCLIVECEDEHLITVAPDDIDRPGDSDVLYALTVADAEAQLGRRLTAGDASSMRKTLEWALSEAAADAIESHR